MGEFEMISKQNAVNACLKGIEKSFNEYYKWSGNNDACGEWLWNAPEYLITVNIAKELSKNSTFLTLEDNVDYVLKHAGKKTGRDSERLRKDGRVDIILWKKECKPNAVVEVKHRVYSKTKNIEVDIKRITEMLKKSESLDFGILAMYVDQRLKNADEVKIEEWSDNFDEKFESIVAEGFKFEIYKKLLDYEENYPYEDSDDFTRFAFAYAVLIEKE